MIGFEDAIEETIERILRDAETTVYETLPDGSYGESRIEYDITPEQAEELFASYTFWHQEYLALYEEYEQDEIIIGELHDILEEHGIDVEKERNRRGMVIAIEEYVNDTL